MIVKELQLPEYGTLEMMLHSPSVELNTAYATKRPAIIICPGGAYAFWKGRAAKQFKKGGVFSGGKLFF